jgi:colicin import membrane protein
VSTKTLFQPEDDFSRGILVSIGLHFVLIALFIFKAVFYPTEPIRMERAIRVDMVGLPEKRMELPAEVKTEAPPAPIPETKPEPQPEPKVEPLQPEKVALPKPEPKKPEAIDLKKTKDSQSNALKRLEALKRLQGSSKPTESTKTANTAPIKGNAISPGTSLTGIAKLEHDDYITALDDKIKQHWNLPAWLANANLKARVRVYLDSRGFVSKMEMIAASPQPVFNEKCMEAIQKAAPFPPPPSRLVNIFAVDGFEVGFPE